MKDQCRKQGVSNIIELKINYRISLFFLIFIMIFSFTSCSLGNMLKSEVIITKKELSDGIKSGPNIYFLCEYLLSEPGKTIIPMYMYSEGKVFTRSVYLYSFNITEEKLTRITELNLLTANTARGDMQITRWAAGDSLIYMMYHAGWDKTTNSMLWNIFRLNPLTNAVDEIKGEDKNILVKKYFRGENFIPVSKENLVSSSRIWYYTGVLPDELWKLPSPVSYSDLNDKQYIRIIVDRLGDRYFCEEIFRHLKAVMSAEKLSGIIQKMEMKFNGFSGYEKMQYRPYMEEWSSRIYIESKFMKKTEEEEIAGFEESVFRKDIKKSKELLSKNPEINKPDAYGLTPLMIASYVNNSEIADDLIKRGADINAQDKNGCTPLMYAVFGRAHRTMELLIKRGADKKKESLSGWISWMFVSDTRLRQRFLELTGK